MMQILSKNILLLTFLYLIQGLPYGFQARFLPIYLRTQGVSLTSVGLFKLLLIPWLCKALWAPLVDKYGTKRKWLLWSISALAITCFVCAFISPTYTPLLCMMLFLLNVCASTQDIAVDGIALKLLSDDELGKGNTAQVVGYKIGSLIGGGILVTLIEYLGWTGMFLVLTGVYIEALVFVLILPSLKELEATESQENGEEDSGGEEEDDNEEEEEKYSEIKDDEGVSTDKGSRECSPSSSNDSEQLQRDGNERGDCEVDTGNKKEQSPKDASSGNSESPREAATETLTDDDLDDVFETVEEVSGANEASDARAATKRGMDKSALKSFAFLNDVLTAPGTRWMLGYVILYKLGEQGCLGMFPLFLIDQKLKATDVAIWTGVVGQMVSICGSLLGGMLLSRNRLPPFLVLRQMFLFRFLPMGSMLWIITMWTYKSLPESILHSCGISAFLILLLISGIVTTATFTFMMQCSKGAPEYIQTTHYTTLATFEVFGKLAFMSVAGFITDAFGYGPIYVLFIFLTVVSFFYLKLCPRNLIYYQPNKIE